MVCSVVNNNKIPLVTHFEPIKIYTLQHNRSSCINPKRKIVDTWYRDAGLEVGEEEAKICNSQWNHLTCNGRWH